MKNIKLTALKIVLLIFAAEFLIMLVLDHAALPHFWGTSLDSAAIAIAVLFLLRYHNKAIACEKSRFSGFAAQMPDSVVIVGLDGKITYVNPAFEKATGRTQADTVGESPDIFRSGKHPESFFQDLRQTIESGKTWRGQITSKKKDGALYTEDAVIFPVLDESGRLAEFIGIWKDITDKLLAEEKILKHLQTGKVLNKILKLQMENRPLAEILQRTLAEILSVEQFSAEAKGAILLADEKTNTLKIAASAGLGAAFIKTCGEVVTGNCLCGRVMAGGKPMFKAHVDGDHEMSYEGMTDHGHYIIPIISGARTYGVLNIYITPGHVRSETDISFLSAIADILAGIIHRKKMNEYLSFLRDLHVRAAGTQDSKASLKLLVTNICEIADWPIGEVWLPDMDKPCLYRVSVYHTAAQGIEAFAAQSSNFRFKKGEGLPGRVWESKKTAWVPDVTKDANFPRKNIALACGIKAAVAIPIIVGGEVEAVVNFLTVREGAEDEEFVNFLMATADQMSMILSQNLLSEQLVQAQKMDTVGKLAGGIAHDFNNILGAILGYTNFLTKDLENMPQQLSDALEVKKAAERAAALTKQLLTFSRKKAAVQRNVNLNDAIKGLLPMLGKITGENIKLEFSPREGITLIKIDPTHLEQVIMNLVINARDAMPGGGTITIKTEETGSADGLPPAGQAAGKCAVFSVSDTGTGMSEEIKKRIFEPFFTTKPTGKGTGMGLSIVYGVIKQNNAQITVDSVLNEGTTFTVYIPAADENETIAAPESRKPGANLRGTETILIAEDDDAFRAVLLRVLKEQGYNALAAANAGEALSLAKEHTGKIHLLLTDMRMPGKTGAELAEEILKSRPDIGLLYMTGYSDADILDQHHINDTVQLHKPIEFPQLLAKIREMLDERSNGRK